MIDIIKQCSLNIGEAPRNFSLLERITSHRISIPTWFRYHPNDGLKLFFESYKNVLRNGLVVWGHIIQVNSKLFVEGKDDLPGEVVFSFENHSKVGPDFLRKLACDLYELKGSSPEDKALTPIADYLTNELIRVFGMPIPEKLSPDAKCYISTTYFTRKNLPSKRICSNLIPLIVSKTKPYVAIPLPLKYWPKDFISWWVD